MIKKLKKEVMIKEDNCDKKKLLESKEGRGGNHLNFYYTKLFQFEGFASNIWTLVKHMPSNSP